MPIAELWREAPAIRGEIEAVRELLRREIESSSPELAAPLAEAGAAEGKMLRPAFLVIASRFGEPDRDRVRRMAAAVEMFHLATLVHDDVIDGAWTRRRRPTLYARRGARDAVLAGDYLFSRSFLLASAPLDASSVQRLAAAVGHVCASEIAQTEDLYRPSPSVRRYLRRIAGKTAALFAAACRLGAMEGRCPPETVQTLTRTGYDIGMAFQIVDDLLDFTGDADELGKPLLQDLREGIFTLPVVHALRSDPARMRRALERLAARRSPRALRDAADAVRSLGGLEAARGDVDLYTARALREIGRLPDREEKRILAAAAEALRSRTA